MEEVTNVIRRFLLGEIPADWTVARRRDLSRRLPPEPPYEKLLDAEVGQHLPVSVLVINHSAGRLLTVVEFNCLAGRVR